MSKKAVSVTLEAGNLLWLRGRTAASGGRSLSATLDRLITAARLGEATGPVRSVVGTIDISSDDPGLESADAHLRELFARSAARPMVARERGAARRPARKRRRG